MANNGKLKWYEKLWLRVKTYGPSMALGGVTGAAIFGYVNSILNTRRICKLERNLTKVRDVVEHNANCSIYDRKRLDHLVDQHNLLMEKAMRVTEGKDVA